MPPVGDASSLRRPHLQALDGILPMRHCWMWVAYLRLLSPAPRPVRHLTVTGWVPACTAKSPKATIPTSCLLWFRTSNRKSGTVPSGARRPDLLVVESADHVGGHHLADLRRQGSRPAATARTVISRSVSMPTRCSPSQAGVANIQVAHLLGAAVDARLRRDDFHPRRHDVFQLHRHRLLLYPMPWPRVGSRPRRDAPSAPQRSARDARTAPHGRLALSLASFIPPGAGSGDCALPAQQAGATEVGWGCDR